eukprot:334793-Amorphochlora_amoeboformis.AAC.1
MRNYTSEFLLLRTLIILEDTPVTPVIPDGFVCVLEVFEFRTPKIGSSRWDMKLDSRVAATEASMSEREGQKERSRREKGRVRDKRKL